jgi:hypothetical protein
MATKTIGLTSAVASVALVVLMGSQVAAIAQDTPAVQAEAARSESPIHRAHKLRALTVRRSAPVEAPAAPNVVAAPLGVASTIVGLPFQVIGGITGYGAGPRSGGVTNVRYIGAGAETAKLDEGFVTPVPVDHSGPIYVVKNGDPTVNPLTFIGAPIAAAGQIAQTPFTLLGAGPHL